jgi:hypothetical protein
MTQTGVRQGARCQEHPHRLADQKCDRCGQPFCVECLSPSERLADGTRKWHCPRCVWLIREEEERIARESTLAYRAAQAARRTRIIATSLGAAVLVLGLSAAGYFAFARRFGTAAPEQALVERAGTCGELSRIRSIGAIGTQGPEDAVNVLTYPQRATVSLFPLPGLASAPDPASIVDECLAGWRVGTPAVEEIQLPVTLQLDTGRDASYLQRVAFWQDPQAPRGAWVRDFELLASSSATAEDFAVVPLDRDPVMRDSTEPQWFEVMRLGPGAVPQKFPDIVPARRLRLRVLSTWATSRRGVKVDQVSLGEMAAYGPDLEITIADVPDSTNFQLSPNVVRAIAGQPKFIMFLNPSKSTHHFVSSGQQQNFDVTLAPGEVKSVQFVAGRAGQYEFVCKVLGHEFSVPRGRIQVR